MSGIARRETRRRLQLAPDTLFLGIPSGTAAANVLRTPIFSTLRQLAPDLHLVVLSPLSREPHFVEEFSGPRVTLEYLEPHDPGAVERRIIRVLQEKYVRRMPTASMRVRVARASHAEREVRYLDRLPLEGNVKGLRRAGLTALGSLPVDLAGWFTLLDLVTLGSRYRELFRRHRPKLVVTPTSGLYFSEGPLLARATRAGVPTMAIDLSWDHFTTKTAPLRPVSRMCVWNEPMRDEAMRLHGYRFEQVAVTGVPQFDQYADRAALGSRAEFLESIGMPSTARLVTVTTVPPVLYPGHDEVVDHLLRARRDGLLGKDVRLLVRVHQRDELDRYQRFEGVAGLRVEKPFRHTIVAEGSSVDPSTADRRHLARTLLHSDVVVNVASTIAIEAAILDTQIVNIGFDLPTPKPYLDSAARFYDYTHYRPLVTGGAVAVAHSPGDMVGQVRAALEHPERRREERAAVARLLAYRIDGGASRRIAEEIVTTLRSGTF